MKFRLYTIYSSLVITSFFLSCSSSGNKPEAKEPKNENSQTATPPAQNKGNVDIAKSTITWIGSDPIKSHKGTIGIANGMFHFDQYGKINSGTIEVDMNAITVTDETSDEKKPKLISHLRGNDFFAADSFPTSKFEITSVAIKDANRTLIGGNLTIRGITRNIMIPVNITENDGVMNFKATFSFDRTKWNVNYHSKTIDAKIKDKAISDMIELEMDIYCNKK